MRFTVTFHLGNFVEWFPADALRHIAFVQHGSVILCINRKHNAVRQIAIVRDGQQLAPGLIFIALHPFPQVSGVGAARRVRCIRHPLAALISGIPIKHNTVHVVAGYYRGPFIANERSKFPWLVELFSRSNDPVPDRPIGFGIR